MCAKTLGICTGYSMDFILAEKLTPVTNKSDSASFLSADNLFPMVSQGMLKIHQLEHPVCNSFRSILPSSPRSVFFFSRSKNNKEAK